MKCVKKYYSCLITQLYFIHLNEFHLHTSFLEWTDAFMVPIVHSSRHFEGFAINNTIHQTLKVVNQQKSEKGNFLSSFSKLYFGEIATSRILKIT